MNPVFQNVKAYNILLWQSNMATRGQLHLAYVDEAIGKLTKIQEFINAGMEGAIDITEDLVAATDSGIFL